MAKAHEEMLDIMEMQFKTTSKTKYLTSIKMAVI